MIPVRVRVGYRWNLSPEKIATWVIEFLAIVVILGALALVF